MLIIHNFCCRVLTRGVVVNRSVSLRINTKGNRTAEFIELVNSEGFEEKLAAAVKDSTSSVAVDLKRNLLPLVQIAGHNLK